MRLTGSATSHRSADCSWRHRAERVIAWRIELGTTLPPAMLANHDARIEVSLKRAQARTLPCGVVIDTQSPGEMRRSRAASGCISTSGDIERLRRLARARFWLCRNRVGLAQVSSSGNRAARSAGRPGRSWGRRNRAAARNRARGGSPSRARPVATASRNRAAALASACACLACCVLNGTRTPSGSARNCSSVTPEGASCWR